MLVNNFLRKMTQFFRGKKFFYNTDALFAHHTENYKRSLLLVRAFYALSFLLSLEAFHWMTNNYAHKIYYDPIWPFVFLKDYQVQYLFTPAMIGWILGSLLSMFYIESRFCRCTQAVSIFLVVAIINSDGHFAHNNHGFLWISMILAMISVPKSSFIKTPRSQRHLFILSVWFCQFMICTFYLMTGYWKIASLINCAVNPALQCQLDHWILTNITAREAIYYNQFAPWRDAFYKYPWIAFFSYLGTIWIHVVSLYFAFRLDLHKVFGFLRLIFHLGTFLFFGVNFSAMAYPVALLFLFSPFDRQPTLRFLIFELMRLPPMCLILPKKDFANERL